jgi:hypothetical protein
MTDDALHMDKAQLVGPPIASIIGRRVAAPFRA